MAKTPTAAAGPEKKETPNAPQAHAHQGSPKADAPAGGKKGYTPMPGGCFSWGCKANAKAFNFCDEHYDHFKFGIIKKTGEPVSDYEKKIGHYQAYKARQGVRKAA